MDDVNADGDTAENITQDEQPSPTDPVESSRSASRQTLHRDDSRTSSFGNAESHVGRPLVRAPTAPAQRSFSNSSTSSSGSGNEIPYLESGKRTMEKMEASAIRKAMEELDVKDEKRLFEAAQDEAAGLVWKHQNPNAPENNPDAPYRYPGHLRKTSHGRSQSLSKVQEEVRADLKMKHRHSLTNSIAPLFTKTDSGSRTSSNGSNKMPSTHDTPKDDTRGRPSSISARSIQTTRISATPSDVMPDPKNHRRSSGSRRKASGSLFANPDDKIYEEPEELSASAAEKPEGHGENKSGSWPQEPKKPEPPKKQESAPVLPLSVRRNPFARIKFSSNALARSNTDPAIPTAKKFDRFEIHRNPPTQSRNPGYTSNPVSATPTPPGSSGNGSETEVKTKDGKEIRGDDIRAATSMRLKDRSAKLPTPTMVSDSPGRPIVSFQQDYKPTEIELKMEKSTSMPTKEAPKSAQPTVSAYPPKPSAAASAPIITIVEATPVKENVPYGRSPSTIKAANEPAMRPIPSINVNENSPPIPVICVPDAPDSRSTPSISINGAPRPVPSISVNSAPSTPIPSFSFNDTPAVVVNSVNNTPIPTICVGETSSNKPSVRPLPTPGKANHPANVSPKKQPFSNKTASRWTPSARGTGALCSNCALPIAGRIVSAAGSRFHPECFTCFHCHEHLECVAFYPEPEKKREERVARIRARQSGDDIPIPDGMSIEDARKLEETDGFDESLRFYCHLDFHEFFSPRCKSCKTPIEGEVIVACGAEWHAGHFFCAQCGDPFDATMPFVEKDGYAWCVGCHTNRYSAKCRRCRKPVTDLVVKALGSEWHESCFVCTVSLHGASYFDSCSKVLAANEQMNPGMQWPVRRWEVLSQR